MRISFFRTPSPKSFSYKPRYWDERKEEIERIKARYAEPEKKDDPEVIKQRIRSRWSRSVDKETRKRSSALTLLVYLLIIALLVWFIFF